MARSSAALRDRPVPAATARPLVPREPAGRTETSAVLPLVLRADRREGLVDAPSPVVSVVPATRADGPPAPAVIATRQTPDTAPAVTPDRPGCPYATAGGRLTAFIMASILLHTAVAAFAVWIALTRPPAATSGDDAIPVELVVAAEDGAAARRETASGMEDTTADAVPSQARQPVEAPQVTGEPRPPAEPLDAARDEMPVDQLDPLTRAERILDQLPVPPMPETVPVIETARPPQAETPPVTETPPVAQLAEAPPTPEPPRPDAAAIAAAIPVPDMPAEAEVPAALQPPAREPDPDPHQVAAALPVPDLPAQTQVPAELQAALPDARPDPVPEPPPSPPRPAAVRQTVSPPPVPPVAAQPASRREAPTAERRLRPTRAPAANPRPERRPRASRQTAAQAREAPRGEGTGRRNSQESRGSAASGAASAAAMAGYRARVLAHLARFKVYPDQARERGITGRAVLAFTLSASGQVTASSLAGSSGAAVLDQATLAMLRRAQPFPPMPPGSPATMRFTAGIRYNLH